MRKKPQLPDVEPVRLRPISGIRPGAVILAAIIAFALILAFLLFLLPGIVQKGGYVRFITNTSDTAIWAEDGSYIGSSEGSVYYLPHGTSTFHFSIYGADAGSVTVDIPHRILFTLFSHKVTDVRHDTENTEEIEKAVRTEFLSEVASWSRVIDYDDRYHFPPLFSSFAKNAVALGFGDISSEMLYGAMHITSAAMEEDFQNALDILSSSSVRYSTPGLEAIAGKRPEPLPSTSIRTVGKPERNGSFFSYPSMAITLGWSDEESFPEANERLVDTAFGAFSIAERPVSEYEYALFTEANPYWSAANKDELIADGMVDDGYLDGITLTTRVRSTLPIRNISYHAAEAYVEWLSERDGASYMIPTEAEWTAAALSAEGKHYALTLIPVDNDPSTPSFMMGQLWEMTSTPYIPLMRLYGYDEAVRLGTLYPFDDIIIKGGSYINDPDEVTVDTVGVAGRSMTSEYMTLRIGIRDGNQVDTAE